METIRHRVGVDAPINDVYDAIATPGRHVQLVDARRDGALPRWANG